MKLDSKLLQPFRLSFAILFSLLVLPATAVPLTEWGARAGTSVSDCPSFCTNFNFGPTDGGVGQLTASSTVLESRGDADGFAGLTGGLSVPVLRARGESIPGQKGAGGSAFGSQGYTYNGPAKTITLDLTLTGTLEDPDSTSRGEIDATVVLFSPENYAFTSDLPSLVFEFGATPLTLSGGLGDAQVDLALTETGSINQTASISVDVSDGDQFYIWAFLDADAVSSSSARGLADAFNTLGMSFTDPTGLTPAAVVPEPTSLAMLLVACCCPRIVRRD